MLTGIPEMASSEVYLGSCFPSSAESNKSKTSLLRFMFRIHQYFGLERTCTETFLLPRDEITLFKLVLRSDSTQVSPSPDFWAEVCRHRICPSLGAPAELTALAFKVDTQLECFNLVDRALLVSRIAHEWQTNLELKTMVHNAAYIVTSWRLDWFEYFILVMLIRIKTPNITFLLRNDASLPLFRLRLCNIGMLAPYRKCAVTDVLLAYLGLAVNIKDPIRLLRVISIPKRGLDRRAFTSLRHLAVKTNLSVTQVAISFTCQTSSDNKVGSSEDFRALEQWKPGLHHLVECLTKCQDALSGVSDDQDLVNSASEDRMGYEEAIAAVTRCIRITGRFLRKPMLGAGKCDGDEVYDRVFTNERISQAVSTLCHKLTEITALDAVSCSETPGRSLLRGGSLRGRAASKLARMFLVFHDEPVSILDGCSNPSWNNATSPLRSPSRRLCAIRTPVTEGRGERILQMFVSPQTPIQLATLTEPVEEVENSEDACSFRTSRFKPDLFDNATMPERPVFSRYQTNLDWADSKPSPMTNSFRSFSRSPLRELDTHSLPAWLCAPHSGVHSAPSDGHSLSGASSGPTTPLKVRKPADRHPRSLFDESTPSAGSSGTTKNCPRTSYVNISTNLSNRGKRMKLPKADHKQRSLLDFFKL
ncbi:unnamed protein product [Dicrocoelium dendriticum]|nr:unnamed protein product [Dicrocoelium dendriticum]